MSRSFVFPTLALAQNQGMGSRTRDGWFGTTMRAKTTCRREGRTGPEAQQGWRWGMEQKCPKLEHTLSPAEQGALRHKGWPLHPMGVGQDHSQP